VNLKNVETKTKEPEESEETGGESPQMFFLNTSNGDSLDELRKVRLVTLYGEVDEEKASELTYTLFMLKNAGRNETPEDPDDPESEVVVSYEPIEMVVSTYGGSAAEMFSIYDSMRLVRNDCDISTLALGKVMSAGVLILAAGTKGKRKIGANCRVMLHGVTAGSQGNISNLENEIEEIRFTQQQHINALVKETKMTKRHLKKLLNKKVNVYLTAEEAVELGIADEIV